MAIFRLTKQSLKNLRDEGIPDEILRGLQSLKNKEITKENKFLDAVEKQIGREQTVRYQELILEHTRIAVKSVGRYIRVSPRKARLVIDMIRGRDVPDALDILRTSSKAVASTIEKIVNVGVSNAEDNEEITDVDNLYIKEAFVDQGPTMKRFQPRAMGRATRIRKRTSHITIILEEKP